MPDIFAKLDEADVALTNLDEGMYDIEAFTSAVAAARAAINAARATVLSEMESVVGDDPQ